METYNFTQEEKYAAAQKRVKCIKGFYVHATIYLAVNLIIIAGNSIDNADSLLTLNPYMTAVFWGIGLFAHGLSVFGKNLLFGPGWEEKEIQKILRK